MTPSIRPAAPADWPAIRYLIERAELPTEDLSPSAVRWFTIAVEDSRILGAIALESLDDESAMLRSLAVDASERGRGLGGALVREAEAQASLQRKSHIHLLTTTAERFFSQLGYEDLDREHAPECVRAHSQFRSLCPTSAVLMRKVLNRP